MRFLRPLLIPFLAAGLLLWLVVGGVSMTTTAASGRAEPAAVVWEQLEAQETVRVIVGLALPTFQPEGNQPNRQAVAQQRAAIAAAQEALVDSLASYQAEVYATYRTIPYLAVEVDRAGLEALANDGRVTYISEDKSFYPTLSSSTAVIGAAEAWAEGYEGDGQTVVVIDSGIDASHPFFEGRVVDEACFSNPFANPDYTTTSLCPSGQYTQTGSGAADSLIEACQSMGANLCAHGTHVAGIVAGQNESFSGVAPHAQIVGIQVFSRLDDAGRCFPISLNIACITAEYSDILLALEYVYTDLRLEHSIAAVNMSLGGGEYNDQATCDSDLEAVKAIIDQLRAADIATVIASGNDSWTNALAGPACISTAVAVGSTTDADQISSFSDMHPMVDLLAPGSAIESAVPGGGYANYDGTSMAAPHVAGAWAVLKEQHPNASVDEILALLQNSGVPIQDGRTGGTVTRPRIDFGGVFGPHAIVGPEEVGVIIEAQISQTSSLTITNIGQEPLQWSLFNVPTTTADRSAADALQLNTLISVTHSASQQIMASDSTPCSEGDRSWYRVFDLPALGIAEPLDVTAVEVGIEEAVSFWQIGQLLDVNLYTLTGDLASGTLTGIGGVQTAVADQALSIVTIPVEGHVPAGSQLVVEVYHPTPLQDGYLLFGSNSGGQTGPSYMKAPACGINTPTDVATLGYPNKHLVLNVWGELDDSLTVCNQSVLDGWVALDPLFGTVPSNGVMAVSVAVDASSLNQGVHTDVLCFETNDAIRPLIRVPLSVDVPSCAGLPNCVALPHAGFNASAASGIAPLTVVFTNTSSGTIDGYQWAFGDGATSTAAHPQHQFMEAGIYEVTLTVSNAAGTDDSFHTLTVYAPAEAQFSAAVTTGTVPLTTTFTNESSGDYDQCLWDFGDGQQLQSCQAQVQHTYQAIGNYDVILAISGDGGTDLLEKPNYINVSPSGTVSTPLQAMFNAAVTSGPAPFTATFTNQSVGEMTQCVWDFGDGEQLSSCAAEVTHVYTEVGSYDVVLSLSNADENSSHTEENYIVVVAPAETPPRLYLPFVTLP